MKQLIVATSNPGKLEEIAEYLTVLDWELELKPKELDIEETGTTFQENAALKASQVAKSLGKWAIGDDSGLAVDALNGAPGIYSARYGQTDEQRIERLLKELGNNQNRQAQFICAIAIASPDGSIVWETEGICRGEILAEPRGKGGFGYDPLFFVPQYQQTFAEMNPEIKREVSHRGQAFALLLPQLRGSEV
ncbi:RdgB/HAM1 family non-canonical purine NTP pyrophosphatase [Aphanothece sacrum]|uniref:dITP/XTP pyrophosphatase n=1 Tax=Aphanothece sacrum FPU1 TaxID=1920663 RepID=A0A401ILR4_APHSA|nr:RdgB/HAM1 family non-canonical purine NTP pyrophosphatase [Aphanothece sacrum]GBF82192.1 non-canonical purine NTP pyrophosphatase [Aphanothece sacrum FPU1]GBF87270.1 non-canonical purine NTP pyrophosphatase [Aphanothece sacrum FPU3]